jgi:hypothetical protein
MRTTVDIEPSLLRRLRDEAHRRGIPFKEMLTTIIQRGLDGRREPERRFRTPTFAMGDPGQKLNLAKALRVAEELHDDNAIQRLASGRRRR